MKTPMSPECESFLKQGIKDGLAQGKPYAIIGKELSPIIKQKFDVNISAEAIRTRTRESVTPRIRPRPSGVGYPPETDPMRRGPAVKPRGYTDAEVGVGTAGRLTHYAWCPTCKANYQNDVCPGCLPDETPATEPTAIIPARIEPTGELTVDEREKLESLEGVIKQEMGSFVVVGNALLTIRDHGLYREGYKTFDDYCREKWDISRRHADRLITGSQVVANLGPRGLIMTACEIQPINEKQVRPLTVLEPDQQCEVWEEAVRSADGKVVTFRQVKALVEARIGSPPQKPKPDPHRDSDAMYFTTIAISQMTRIRDDDSRRLEAMDRMIKWCQENRTKLKKREVK